MVWTYLFMFGMYAVTTGCAWFLTSITFIGWANREGKIKYGLWFREFSPFVVPLWFTTIVIYILIPIALLG